MGIMAIAIAFGFFVCTSNNTFCAVLSGIMEFYLVSSRLMYFMSKEGYLPLVFGKIDEKHGTPKNARIFCIAISLVGPVLGREALGWFVDMSAIGASIGYFFTCLAAAYEIKKYKDAPKWLEVLCWIGVGFSVAFMILQLIPIPGLEGVHFEWQSYVMLGVWILLGVAFFILQRKQLGILQFDENSDSDEEVAENNENTVKSE